MSTVDRAFIRAYDPGDRHEAPAAAPQAAAPASPAPATTAAPTYTPPAAPHFRTLAAGASAAPPVSDKPAAERERKPLSTLAASAKAVEAKFRPAFEVDEFQWTEACTNLISAHRARWRDLISTLMAADDAGCSLIGVGGIGSGVGATTVLTGLARLLVDAGKTIAIVDGDFRTAGLAGQLGLAIETGWEDVLAGKTPLAESVVYSLGDRIALLPLVNGGVPASEQLDAIHSSVTAGVLRYHYDIVLFDLGSVIDPIQGPIAARVAQQCRLDGALVVAGPLPQQRLTAAQLTAAAPDLARISFGVIENQSAAA